MKFTILLSNQVFSLGPRKMHLPLLLQLQNVGHFRFETNQKRQHTSSGSWLGYPCNQFLVWNPKPATQFLVFHSKPGCNLLESFSFHRQTLQGVSRVREIFNCNHPLPWQLTNGAMAWMSLNPTFYKKSLHTTKWHCEDQFLIRQLNFCNLYVFPLLWDFYKYLKKNICKNLGDVIYIV